jgi:hypothetical protein
MFFRAEDGARRRLIISVYRIFNLNRVGGQKDFARERRERCEKEKTLNVFF